MAVTINGSAGVTTNSGAVYDSLQRATAVTASGTSVEFTSIPTWVRRITMMLSGVSTNGSNNLVVQIGSGSYTTSGYVSVSGASGGGTQFTPTANFTSGMVISNQTGATAIFTGHIVLTLQTGNTWIGTHVFCDTGTARVGMGSGSVALAGVLDRVRIIGSATGSPSDTFDAGTINILYE